MKSSVQELGTAFVPDWAWEMVGRGDVPGEINWFSLKCALFTLWCDDISRPELLMVLKCFKTGLTQFRVLVSALQFQFQVVHLSYCQATRIFTSNLKEKMAQRFFNLILLPRFNSLLAQHCVNSLNSIWNTGSYPNIHCVNTSRWIISLQDQGRHRHLP